MTSWSSERVAALAPDPASASAGQALASERQWASLGRSDRAIWGLCQGSGKQPVPGARGSRRARIQVQLPEPQVPLQARPRFVAALCQACPRSFHPETNRAGSPTGSPIASTGPRRKPSRWHGPPRSPWTSSRRPNARHSATRAFVTAWQAAASGSRTWSAAGLPRPRAMPRPSGNVPPAVSSTRRLRVSRRSSGAFR